MPPEQEQPQKPEQVEPIRELHHTRLLLFTIVMILTGILAVGYFWYLEKEDATTSTQATDIINQ